MTSLPSIGWQIYFVNLNVSAKNRADRWSDWFTNHFVNLNVSAKNRADKWSDWFTNHFTMDIHLSMLHQSISMVPILLELFQYLFDFRCFIVLHFWNSHSWHHSNFMKMKMCHLVELLPELVVFRGK